MRTAVDYYTEFMKKSTGENLFAIHPKNEFILKAIEQAQTEAWNEAIEAAAENAKADWSGMAKVWVDKESILKLKR